MLGLVVVGVEDAEVVGDYPSATASPICNCTRDTIQMVIHARHLLLRSLRIRVATFPPQLQAMC